MSVNIPCSLLKTLHFPQANCQQLPEHKELQRNPCWNGMSRGLSASAAGRNERVGVINGALCLQCWTWLVFVLTSRLSGDEPMWITSFTARISPDRTASPFVHIWLQFLVVTLWCRSRIYVTFKQHRVSSGVKWLDTSLSMLPRKACSTVIGWTNNHWRINQSVAALLLLCETNKTAPNRFFFKDICLCCCF